MKSTSKITRKGDTSTQVGTASQERKLISNISLIVLGASLFMLVAMTIILHQGFMATGENGLLTYVVGMLAIVVFIWLSTSLALRISSSKKAKPAQHDEVLEALIVTIRTNPDPDARLAAVKGLSELNREESTKHMKHEDIDAILISVLETDPDSRVRSAAADGLPATELEKHSYYRTQNLTYA